MQVLFVFVRVCVCACVRVCGERGKRKRWKERKGKRKKEKELALVLRHARNSIFTHAQWHLAGNRGWGSIPRGEEAWRSMHVFLF